MRRRSHKSEEHMTPLNDWCPSFQNGLLMILVKQILEGSVQFLVCNFHGWIVITKSWLFQNENDYLGKMVWMHAQTKAAQIMLPTREFLSGELRNVSRSVNTSQWGIVSSLHSQSHLSARLFPKLFSVPGAPSCTVMVKRFSHNWIPCNGGAAPETSFSPSEPSPS